MLSVRCVATFEAVFGASSRELWLFRALWLVLPFIAGPMFANTLDDSETLFQRGASALLWAGWAILLVATMVPRTETLTLMRVIPFAGLLAAVGAAIGAGSDVSNIAVAAGVASIAIAAVLALRAPIGDVLVDGSSYGDERRFLLSTPGPLLLGPLAVVVAVIITGALAGPLLLLSERWVAGAIALAFGWALAWYAVPILHRLSNRWLVFVPAGMVVHDKTALREPQLFRVEDVAAFGPAPADADEQDLSLDALGLALRIELKDTSKIIKNGRDKTIDLTEISGFIVSPNRPGAVIEEARTRGYPIA